MFRKVAFSIAVSLVLGLTACGGGGPPDAAQVYSDAGEAMAALTSYHVTAEGLDEGEPFRFELDLVPPDRFQLTEEDEGNIIGIGDQLYFSPPEFAGYFFAPEEFFGLFDTSAFLTALTTEIFDLTYLGEEAVDGVATHHLQGALPPAVLELVEPEEEFTKSITVELWVGLEDSLVHRYLLAPLDPDEETTLTLSRFDEAISIEAPANPRPIEELYAEVFLEEIEGLPSEQGDCLRQVLGDDVFAEIEAGVRLPTEEQFQNSALCFVFPEDVKREFEGLSAEEQDCLRRVLGDTVFEELEAGARLPTAEEFLEGGECFR